MDLLDEKKELSVPSTELQGQIDDFLLFVENSRKQPDLGTSRIKQIFEMQNNLVNLSVLAVKEKFSQSPDFEKGYELPEYFSQEHNSDSLSTCCLATIRNALLVYGVYDSNRDTENQLMSEILESERFEDGLISHIDPTIRILESRGLVVFPTRNPLEVSENLIEGGVVSLNMNKHIVLVTGIRKSGEEISFKIYDPDQSQKGPYYIEMNELFRYVIDLRFITAAGISKKIAIEGY